MVTHAGMTTADFEMIVTDWLVTARHPRFKRPYTELVYQPMLELLAYLRANDFQTFIASGGGIEFMRPWTQRVYGVPPSQVVGSSIKTKFEMRDGTPLLFRLPQVNFIDDKAGKPVGINEHIGKRPIAAFGNSDGDLEMLQWATLAGDRRRFGMIVHHTDAEREYAYDRNTHFGRLDVALDAAAVNGWTVASMKTDWKEIFPVANSQGVGGPGDQVTECTGAGRSARVVGIKTSLAVSSRCERPLLQHAVISGKHDDLQHSRHPIDVHCLVEFDGCTRVRPTTKAQHPRHHGR